MSFVSIFKEDIMDRKSFIKTGIISSLGLTILPNFSSGNQESDPEPLKLETVKEFVSAGHKDLNKVKEMLNDYPNLIYCKYDWGNGDFEEAIGGAGHMGNKEIANYLIDQGARVNLFVLTMLGKTELVKPILEEYPTLINAKGPHGFTLLHHAKVGGHDSLELLEYLTKKGLTESKLQLK